MKLSTTIHTPPRRWAPFCLALSNGVYMFRQARDCACVLGKSSRALVRDLKCPGINELRKLCRKMGAFRASSGRVRMPDFVLEFGLNVLRESFLDSLRMTALPKC